MDIYKDLHGDSVSIAKKHSQEWLEAAKEITQLCMYCGKAKVGCALLSPCLYQISELERLNRAGIVVKAIKATKMRNGRLLTGEERIEIVADKILHKALSLMQEYEDDLPATFDAPTPEIQVAWDRYIQEIVTILRGELPEKTE